MDWDSSHAPHNAMNCHNDGYSTYAKRWRGALIIFTNYYLAWIMFSWWFHHSTLETFSILSQPDLSYNNFIWFLIFFWDRGICRVLLRQRFRGLSVHRYIWMITFSWRLIRMFVCLLGYLTGHHIFFRGSIIDPLVVFLIFSNVSIFFLSVELLVPTNWADLLLRLHVVLLHDASLIMLLVENV